jgi:hypothetical protein
MIVKSYTYFATKGLQILFVRFCFVFMLGIGTTLRAQTSGSRNVNLNLQEIALLDIEPTGTLNFSFTAPSEAGNTLTTPSANTTKWLNYTSAVTVGNTRNVTAHIDAALPGVAIKIQAGAVAAGGGGALGVSAGQVTLSTTPVNIITGIGGAYTGNGANRGHQLTISLEVSDFSELSQTTNEVITITYTITD